MHDDTFVNQMAPALTPMGLHHKRATRGTSHVVATALELHASGHSVRAAAKKAGCAPSSLSRALSRLQVPHRKAGRPRLHGKSEETVPAPHDMPALDQAYGVFRREKSPICTNARACFLV